MTSKRYGTAAAVALTALSFPGCASATPDPIPQGPYVVEGGAQMYQTRAHPKNPSTPADCTVGFLVHTKKTPANEVGFLTSGSCVSSLEAPVYADDHGTQKTIGTVDAARTVTTDGKDMAYIRVAPGVAWSSAIPSMARLKSSSAVPRVAEPATAAWLRAHPPERVCSRGAHTGRSCGSIVSVTDTKIEVRLDTDIKEPGSPMWAEWPDGSALPVAIQSGVERGGPSVVYGQLLAPYMDAWRLNMA